VNTPHTSEPKGEWAERPYMEVERAARDCIDPRYSRDQTSRVTRTRVKRARGATALASAVKTPRGVVPPTRLSRILRISAANYAQGLLRLSDRRERDRDRRQERAVEGAWRRGRLDPRELVRGARTCVATRVPWFAHSDIIS
jgi:hypothetical protein